MHQIYFIHNFLIEFILKIPYQSNTQIYFMIFEYYHLMLPFDLLMIFYKIIYNFIFRNLIQTYFLEVKLFLFKTIYYERQIFIL